MRVCCMLTVSLLFHLFACTISMYNEPKVAAVYATKVLKANINHSIKMVTTE